MAYARALEDAGLSVQFVSEDEQLPDCVFVEDTAVIWRDRALVTRMHPAREGEQAAVESVLSRDLTLVRLHPDAKLEGGDVLHIGQTTYVGLSSRTNAAGAESLQAFLQPFGRRVVTIETKYCLHLKTGMSYLGNGTLLTVPDWFDLARFEVDDVIYTECGEHGSANCLRIHDHLLIPNGYPETRKRIEKFVAENALKIRSVEISEFETGDGSLSCLSLIW